jgi:phage repressor protein C with HTH and peptisase S24 domain
MAKTKNPKKTKIQSLARSRYKNEFFLKALGEHCRALRIKKGYSIDRLAKEANQLSPASVHRLERGLADSQILVLVRYAEALDVPLMELFTFLKDRPELQRDPRIIPYEENNQQPSGYVPVYPLRVAAGKFANPQDLSTVEPLGWIDAGIRGNSQDYFATFVNGESMAPRIENGSLCLFRNYRGGTRQGRVFLIQARGFKDTETGESFVIKKYVRQTPRKESSSEDGDSTVVHLVSENPKFPPIVLVGLSDDEIHTIAEFVRILPKA